MRGVPEQDFWTYCQLPFSSFRCLKKNMALRETRPIFFQNMGGNKSMVEFQGKICEGIKVEGYFSISKKV